MKRPLSLTAGAADVLLGYNETRVLAPGDYGHLRTRPGAVLALSAGRYRFRSFTLGKDSEIQLDLSGGPVIVDSVGRLRMKRRARMIIVSAAGDPTQILFQVGSDRSVKIGKGDWLMVPSGVNHQFVDIKSPITILSLHLPNAK